ncbi:uncharacterized protein METZ01_LOCUS73973, partial [marine metagenome]
MRTTHNRLILQEFYNIHNWEVSGSYERSPPRHFALIVRMVASVSIF